MSITRAQTAKNARQKNCPPQERTMTIFARTSCTHLASPFLLLPHTLLLRPLPLLFRSPPFFLYSSTFFFLPSSLLLLPPQPLGLLFPPRLFRLLDRVPFLLFCFELRIAFFQKGLQICSLEGRRIGSLIFFVGVHSDQKCGIT